MTARRFSWWRRRGSARVGDGGATTGSRLNAVVLDDPIACRAALDVLRAYHDLAPPADKASDDGELALAAACYALPDYQRTLPIWAGFRFIDLRARLWPWSEGGWLPSSPRADLVAAGALILAEIERLDRMGARLGARLETR